MEKEVYGYVRVSAKDQNEARQMMAITAYGINRENIFIDKQSGNDFNRPQYKKMIRKGSRGDTIVIKSIDRLGRNYEEILEQWRIITKRKGMNIVVLDMPLLNTQIQRDLTGMLMTDIVLQLLSYVAQTEREMIRQRQKEGILAAKERGVRFGRPPMTRPQEYESCVSLWKKGTISAREAGRRLGISHKTFLLWSRNEEKVT